jgi:hypothetical protein
MWCPANEPTSDLIIEIVVFLGIAQSLSKTEGGTHLNFSEVTGNIFGETVK